MPKATSEPTPTGSQPTRRRLFSGAVLPIAAIAAGTASVRANPALDGAVDPVITLYTRWRALEEEQATVEARCDQIRPGLVARHGDVALTSGIRHAWEADPVCAEWQANADRSDELNNECTALLDAMMSAPAMSLEGLRCKMLAGLEVFGFFEHCARQPEYHDDMAMAIMRDAVRLLGGSAAV